MRWSALALAVALSSVGLVRADGGARASLTKTASQAFGITVSAEAAQKTLTFKVRPVAHGPNVYLSDLIEQPLPVDAGAVAVKPSGGPGSVVLVDPALVALKLRMAPGGPYRLKPGYTLLRVPVPAQKIPAKALQDFASDYLDARLSGTAGVVIKRQGRVFGLTLYDSQARLRVRPPEDHPLRGYVELRVDVLQSAQNGEEKVIATVPVSFLIQRQETRLFTTQAVNRGDPLGPLNLQARVMDTTFAPDGFTDMGQAQGKVAKTYIPPDRPLDVTMVDLPIAIHMGDQVRLLVRSGAVEVQTGASAMRDARVGDTLPLRITDSGRQVQARCVDADEAVENAW